MLIRPIFLFPLMSVITFTTVNSADGKLMAFSYFSQSTGCDISCKLSPKRQFALNANSSFGKNKKIIL